MGNKANKLKRRDGHKLTNDKCYRTDANRNQFKLQAVRLTRAEVDEILRDVEAGTYLLYEEEWNKRTYLAFKSVEGKVPHYQIVKSNDLYYFDDFPFPYLESIVLYYKLYKFKGTLLKKQAVLVPQRLTKIESAKMLSASAEILNGDEDWSAENEKTWTYGQFESITTRL